MELISFTDYENVKTVASDIIRKQTISKIDGENLDQIHAALLFQCSQSDNVTLPFFEGGKITLNCTDVKNSDKNKLTD